MLKFPERLIYVSGAAFALRRRKEDVAARAMCYFEGEPVVVERFYVALPTIAAHNGHFSTPLGIAAARLSQRVHPRLLEEIREYVSIGVRDSAEVRKLLKPEVSGQRISSGVDMIR